MFTSFEDSQTEESDPTTGLTISQKLVTWYTNPITNARHQISVSYQFNETNASAIENELLRSPEYDLMTDKKNILEPLYTKELASNLHKLWPTITGLEVHTNNNGDLQWRYFEDKEEALVLIPVGDIPEHIPRIDTSELKNVAKLDVGPIYTVWYRDQMYIVKVLQEACQNKVFRAEVEARIKIGKAPHIVGMVGVVTVKSPIDSQLYVQGILLEYCVKGALKCLLKRSDPPVQRHLKERWAAQIAHGISIIHEAGVIHGDLRCENIVVDKDNNARIIDITDGWAYMVGWNAVPEEGRDPRRDIYSVGVTIWEIFHDGENPPSGSMALSMDQRGLDIGDTTKCVVEDCVAKKASERPPLMKVMEMLGCYNTCGCQGRLSRCD